MTENTDKKILVIEDEDSLLKVITDKLEKDGFLFEVARNGQEGIRKFKEFSPQVVLLDLVMPEKGGFETLKEIRNTESGEKVRVIIFSNMDSFDHVSKGLEYNATEYFVKSNTSLDDIVDIIKSN